MKSSKVWSGIVFLLSLALAGWMAGREGQIWLAFGLVTAGFLYFWGQGIWMSVSTLRRGDSSRFMHITRLLCLAIGLPIYLYLSIWLLRPDLLPQRSYYDLITNRQVTERLVDPALFKVEQWEISGSERVVLSLHPATSGSTTLVYPVKIEPQTTLRTLLAIAPEAWTAEGDGVTFSIYVEDDAGFHLIYSQYVDPKHQQQDRRWIPIQVDLAAFQGKIVHLILTVNSGPAGDLRYDWAGWAEPRLVKPGWP
jgi:hypothetical protein